VLQAVRGSLAELICRPDFAEHQIWSRRDFSANDIIIREGEQDHQVYLVEDGELSVTSTVDLDDNRRVRPGIYTLGVGQIFGELCLFNNLPRTATVTATSDGRLVVFDALRLQAFLDAHPDVGYRVMRDIYDTLVERLSKANKRVEHLFAWGLKAHRIDQHL
jgi:CRP-like cAMP-binding protein